MRFFIFYRALALLLLSLVSCGFNGAFYEERVTLILPEIPPQTVVALGIHSWLVEYPAAEGMQRFYVPLGQKPPILTFNKNSLTPVLAYPIMDGQPKDFAETKPFFKPAGALYPLNCSSAAKKELEPAWQTGFCADFVLALLTRSDLPYKQAANALSRINWARFQSETAKTQNPWLLDSEKLFTSVLNERITIYSFTVKKQREAAVNTGVAVDFLHGDYVPSGFIYPQEGGANVFDCLLADGVNGFISRDYLIQVSTQNSSERLAISAIRRYTD